jgi:hypothetical protein
MSPKTEDQCLNPADSQGSLLEVYQKRSVLQAFRKLYLTSDLLEMVPIYPFIDIIFGSLICRWVIAE